MLIHSINRPQPGVLSGIAAAGSATQTHIHTHTHTHPELPVFKLYFAQAMFSLFLSLFLYRSLSISLSLAASLTPLRLSVSLSAHLCFPVHIFPLLNICRFPCPQHPILSLSLSSTVSLLSFTPFGETPSIIHTHTHTHIIGSLSKCIFLSFSPYFFSLIFFDPTV